MPCALPFPRREQIVRRHQDGEPLIAIARDLGIPYRTARQWWRRFRERGEAGLQTRYQNCGPKQPTAPPEIHAAALALKREHPTWGAGLIRVELLEQFPDTPLPQVRAIQRWFRAAGLQPARPTLPPVARERGKEPHAVWELDAKERMRLGDRSGTCEVTATDEASGAIVGTEVFPPVSLGAGSGGSGPAGAAHLL